MSKGRGLRRLIQRKEGSAAIITALVIVAILSMGSLALDMGHLYSIRNALQNSADGAALAAVSALIQNSSGVAVRNATAAQTAAMTVAQDQSQLSGLPAVADAARNDLTLIFGTWDMNAGNTSTAWTAIGSTCASDSNANAVKVTLTRSAGTAFGAVTNFLAGIMGYNTSQVSATATAYLGYTNEMPSGGVQVPLALPSTGSNSPLASRGHSGWFARLLGPSEAVAYTTKTYVFKDTGGAYVDKTVPTSPTANLDPNQGYFYTGGSSDSVPDTIKNTLAKIYTPSLQGTSSVPVLVPDLTVKRQVYPRSEYCWGRGYIGPIFQNLQKAYYFKTTGNANTAPPAGTKWRTTFAVHGVKTASLLRPAGFMSMARLLVPFWASEAFACSTLTYPAIQVDTFVNADITGVTYNSTTCDDCSYTFPKTINGVTYTDKKDCLTRKTDSTWNANTVTIQNVTDASTVSPPGSVAGGPANKTVNSSAPAGLGPLSPTSAKLVK